MLGRTRMDSPSRKTNETRMILKFVDFLVIYRNFLCHVRVGIG